MTLILWIRKNNTQVNFLLGFIVLIPIFSQLANVLLYTQNGLDAFPIIYFYFIVNLLFGPIVLYYFNLIFGRPLSFRPIYVIHFLPAIFATYVFISYSFFNTEIEKTVIIEKINLGEELYFSLFNILSLIHLLTYLIWANQLRKKYIREAASFFSNIQSTKLVWLKQFIYLVSVLVILILLSYIGAYSINPRYAILSDLIATPFFTFFVYLFVLISAQHNNILFSKESYTSHFEQLGPFNNFIQENFNVVENKKTTQPLKDEICVKIDNSLSQLMTHDKVYLDSSLNISKLAQLVGVTSHQLSFYINFKYKKNFYEFVSIYRIEEAKQRLTNSQYANYKIEVIGEESGFNSKSTFFTTFKKHTGQSPLSYRKSALL